MSSFISNSSISEEPRLTSRRLYARAVISLGLSMLCALSLIYFYLELNDANKQGILGRVNEAQAALTEIVDEPHELVMFFGSSMTRAGFSPRRFDRTLQQQGKDVKSFNFGFGGLNPYFQDLLSRRVVEEFENNDRRLKLAMIEFNPFQTTKTRWNRAKPSLDSFITMLADDRELLEIAKQDITRGVRLFNIKYARNNVSAELITTFYGRGLFPIRPPNVYEDSDTVVAEIKRLEALLDEQFEKEYPDYEHSEWSYAWQGGGTIPQERSKETLELFDQYYAVSHTDARMKNDRLGRIFSADIEELNFEPLLVEHFINIVKNFQAISDNVEVIMLPKNSKWIKNTDEAKQRLARVVDSIEQATGVTIKNHQDIPEITPEMYRDTTHLSRYHGGVVYTDYLIHLYKDRL